MTDVLVAATLTLAVAVGWIGVVRLTCSVRHTSLTAAAAWAIWFQATLTVTTIATVAKSRVPLGVLDQLWYLTSVSALCPFVAVLGARRGRLLEWSLFIVLPLILVLEWPALAQLTRCWHGQRLELELPALIGFGVVMVMSMGNYAVQPDGLTFKAVMWIGYWVLVFFGFTLETDLKDLIGESTPQAFAIVLLQITVREYLEATAKHNRCYFDWDRVWLDYQKYFGAVWALRLMARINEVAQRDQWPWRLTPNGMQLATHDAPHPGSPTADPRVEQTFRWLLKPFVDPEWIDERLTASTDRAAGG